MADSLPDGGLDWAHKFTGVNTIPVSQSAAGPEQQSAGQQGPLTAPPVPDVPQSVEDQLRTSVQTFLGAFTHRDADPEWIVQQGSKTAYVTQEERDKAIDTLGRQYVATMEQGFSRVSYAEGLYAQQKKTDDEWWLTSHVVHFFGRIDDPGPALAQQGSAARSHHSAALAAIKSRDLETAAIEIADCLSASKKAELMAQAYFEGTIGAAEFQVKVLEGVVTASKYTLLALSIIASGGTSAALAGAIAGVANTAMDTINDASMGKPVDWASVTVKLVMEMVMFKYGEGLESALEEEVTKRLVAEGMKVTQAAVTKACAEMLKVAMSNAATAAIKALQGKEVSNGELADEAKKDITSPGSLATEIMKGLVAAGAH